MWHFDSMMGQSRYLTSVTATPLASALGLRLLAICGAVALSGPAFAEEPDDFTIATWRYYCASMLAYLYQHNR